MLACALASGSAVAALGALLFVTSDGLIGYSRFVQMSRPGLRSRSSSPITSGRPVSSSRSFPPSDREHPGPLATSKRISERGGDGGCSRRGRVAWSFWRFSSRVRRVPVRGDDRTRSAGAGDGRRHDGSRVRTARRGQPGRLRLSRLCRRRRGRRHIDLDRNRTTTARLHASSRRPRSGSRFPRTSSASPCRRASTSPSGAAGS